MFQDPQTRQMNCSPKCFEKKSLSDELFLDFSFKSSESDRVSNYSHDSNSIFGVRESIKRYFWRARYPRGVLCFPWQRETGTRRDSRTVEGVLQVGDHLVQHWC